MRIALLFDLDGTLAETRSDIAAAANHALRAVGLKALPEETISTYVGEGASKLIERCVGARQDLHGEALAAWTAYYGEHLLDTSRLYDGVAATLARLPGPLAVISNKPEGMSRRILDGLGIAGRFEGVVGGDTLPVKKPDPAGIRYLCDRLGADRAVLVGDSLVDLATARAAGVPFWGAAYGFLGRAALAEAGAGVLFERFEEVERLREGVR